MKKLEGQVAWVTGAGRGIGRATAFALAALGAKIALSSRSGLELEAVVASLPRPSDSHPFLCDVSDWESVSKTSDQIGSALGPPDILVNNAGVMGPLGKSWEVPPQDWLHTVEINLIGAYYCVRAVLPSMISRGHGIIVNVSSVAATVPLSNWTAYATSKAGLDHFARSLATELKGTGVQVLAIYPGVVRTAMVDKLLAASPLELPPRRRQYFEKLASEGELLESEVVGRVIAWLVSGMEGDLNGSILDFQKEASLLERAAEGFMQLK